MASAGLEMLRGLQLACVALIKPGEAMGQIQERSSYWHAVLPVLMFFAIDAAGLYLTGFVFQTQDPSQVSLVVQAVRVLLPWITWCVAHYAIESVFFGEATFRQIVVASSACLAPLFVLSPVAIAVSNVLSSSEQGTYYFLVTTAAAWTALLFFRQVRDLNDFPLGTTLLVGFLTLGMMVVLWMTAIVIYILTNQLYGFGHDVWYEFLTLR